MSNSPTTEISAIFGSLADKTDVRLSIDEIGAASGPELTLTQNTTTLLSCPFCGFDAVVVPPDDERAADWFVECNNCLATYRERTQDGAIEGWNRRVCK